MAGALRYTGDPRTDFLPGVPARDLTADEAARWPHAAAAAFYVQQVDDDTDEAPEAAEAAPAAADDED